MSMTAGEGDGGAGIMDDASCNSVVETATAAASAAAAASECDSVSSLVKRCAGDGDCRCGGVSDGWGVEWFELPVSALCACVTLQSVGRCI
jgi:hypothetical protein